MWSGPKVIQACISNVMYQNEPFLWYYYNYYMDLCVSSVKSLN